MPLKPLEQKLKINTLETLGIPQYLVLAKTRLLQQEMEDA